MKTGIVHFGVGRFHRAHEALYVQELIDNGCTDWGICGVCMLSFDKFIYENLKAQEGSYHLIERDGKDEVVKKVGSIIEVIYGFETPSSVFQKLLDVDVKIVTFTVTEAGYYFEAATGHLDVSHEHILHDMSHPETPKTLYGYLARGLFLRQQGGLRPFTVQCCDNIQGNGDLVKRLLLEFCEKCYPDLAPWIASDVCFPNSMVDRITPAATAAEAAYVKDALKLNDAVPVTAESFRQWVVEDNYCNDRPDWTSVGVTVVASVKPYEKIKVRLLNGSHTALAYAGHLADFVLVHDVASNETFQAFLRGFMSEVARTLDPVDGVDIPQYQEKLISRFSNPAIEDQIPRLCKDGSSKIPGFIMQGLRELVTGGYACKHVCFVLASWMKFIEQSSTSSMVLDDPESCKLKQLVSSANGNARIFLSDTRMFGDIAQHEVVCVGVQDAYDNIAANGVIASIAALTC